MLREYDVKVSGDHRTVRFDAAKCPTWDGPQSQVEALIGKLLGLGHPHKVDNFQLLDLRVGFISARCSMGRITTRDVELCKEEDGGKTVLRQAMARFQEIPAAPAPGAHYQLHQVAIDLDAPAPVNPAPVMHYAQYGIGWVDNGVALNVIPHPGPNGLGLDDLVNNIVEQHEDEE